MLLRWSFGWTTGTRRPRGARRAHPSPDAEEPGATQRSPLSALAPSGLGSGETVTRMPYLLNSSLFYQYLIVSFCILKRMLGLARVSRNLEKNLPEAPQAPKFFEICHSPLHLPPRGTHSTHVPDKLGTVHMAPGLAPGHYRWTQTVPDLNCLAIFGPSPPQPRRAARRARSSGPTLVPSPAAPAPRSLNSVLRHAGSQSTVMVW